MSDTAEPLTATPVELPPRSIREMLMTYGAFAGRLPTDAEMVAILLRELITDGQLPDAEKIKLILDVVDNLPVMALLALEAHVKARRAELVDAER